MPFFLKFLFVGVLLLAPHFALAQTGWIMKESQHSVSKTADKLTAAIEAGPPKLFARVDHAAGAKSVGEELPEAIMIMFGAPQIGTPIMRENILAGIDLPIRVLIWDDGGQTRIGYLDPMELRARYGIGGANDAFDAMASAIDTLTNAAAK